MSGTDGWREVHRARPSILREPVGAALAATLRVLRVPEGLERAGLQAPDPGVRRRARRDRVQVRDGLVRVPAAQGPHPEDEQRVRIVRRLPEAGERGADVLVLDLRARL